VDTQEKREFFEIIKKATQIIIVVGFIVFCKKISTYTNIK
jgi:hypothetical protein